MQSSTCSYHGFKVPGYIGNTEPENKGSTFWEGVKDTANKPLKLGISLGNNTTKLSQNLNKIYRHQPENNYGFTSFIRVADFVDHWSRDARSLFLLTGALHNYFHGKTDLRIRKAVWVAAHPVEAYKMFDRVKVMAQVDFVLLRSVVMSALDYLTMAAQTVYWLNRMSGKCVKLAGMGPVPGISLQSLSLPSFLSVYLMESGRCYGLQALDCISEGLTFCAEWLRDVGKVIGFFVALQVLCGLHKHGCSQEFLKVHKWDLLLCSLEVSKVVLKAKPEWSVRVASCAPGLVLAGSAAAPTLVPAIGTVAVVIATYVLIKQFQMGSAQKAYTEALQGKMFEDNPQLFHKLYPDADVSKWASDSEKVKTS